MIIVADSSPVIALGRVGQISLLRGVYGEVLIPEAVRDELLAAESAASLLLLLCFRPTHGSGW